MQTQQEEAAQRAQQASTKLQRAMEIARTAARGSTGWEVEDPLKHPARPVPRTRTRLLRAAREPPAFATEAIQATPAQEHAQRA